MNSRNWLSGHFYWFWITWKSRLHAKLQNHFWYFFPVTLVKVEIQESNLHQMNHKKVYFLTCLMQNFQKINMVGCRALNDRANHYGQPCRLHTITFRVHLQYKMPVTIHMFFRFNMISETESFEYLQCKKNKNVFSLIVNYIIKSQYRHQCKSI